MQNPPFIMVSLLFLLACGPLTQLQELGQKGQALATSAAMIDQSNFLVFEAYQKLENLPGYRLENQTIKYDSLNNSTPMVMVREYDSQGNVHILTHTLTEQQQELYFIKGHTYIYDIEHQGWTDLGQITPAEALQRNDTFSNLDQTDNLIQLLPQLGAIPTEIGQEVIQNRPATRYDLASLTTELAIAFDNQLDASTELQGSLWIDDQTGALLRSEIILYDVKNRRSRQEFLLIVTEIGKIEPLTIPTPIITPTTIISATATAQLWTTLEVKFIYQGQSISFEAIPVKVQQINASSDSSYNADLTLNLRHLPAGLPLETNAESLLTQLGHQLKLSIPQQNKVIDNKGFYIKHLDSQNHAIDVIYSFKADLEDFKHVELIIANSDHPLFDLVPIITE